MTGPSGMFLVDKPAGPSSFGVLRQLRPALGSKTGHAGTLDPFATGLLLVVAGRATRLARFLTGMDKRYHAVIQFGAVSTTLDPEGAIEPTGRDHRRRRRESRGGGAGRRHPPAGAGGIGRQDRRAALVCPHAPRRDRRGAARGRCTIDRLDVTGFDPRSATRGDRRDLLEGHLRAPDRRRHRRRRPAPAATAWRCAESRSARGTWPTPARPTEIAADPLGPWYRTPLDALAHLPDHALSADERELVVHGRAIDRRGSGVGDVTRLSHDGRAGGGGGAARRAAPPGRGAGMTDVYMSHDLAPRGPSLAGDRNVRRRPPRPSGGDRGRDRHGPGP